MVIDAHYRVIMIDDVCKDEETAEYRRNEFALYKEDIYSLRNAFQRFHCAGIDGAIALPYDFSACGGDAVSNEDMALLSEKADGKFFCFASVDPNDDKAIEKLEYAFKDLKLKGLYLHPARQHFYPYDKKLYPLYEMCKKYNKPITFHCGFAYMPNTISEYSRPIHFEKVAADFPDLRICLAHMGFPWTKELAVLLLKYPNLYADTSALYFDSALEFYKYLFNVDLGRGWVDRSIRHQVMFGSNIPRWEQARMLRAIKEVGFRDETVDLITQQNAMEFLGMEEPHWWS